MPLDDPILARLVGNVRKAQSDLFEYLSTEKAPQLAKPLIDPNLVPLAKVLALVPSWSDDKVRRIVKKKRLGRMIGARLYVDMNKFTAYVEQLQGGAP